MAKDAVGHVPKGKQPSTSQKSMYTPVFYTPSQVNAIASSSANGKPSKKGKEREKVTIPNLSSANLRRLEALSKRHIALQDVFEEVPDSRSNSERSFASKEPDADVQKDLEAGVEPKIATNARIRHLRTKVAAARQDAQDNTAHGKWELVSRLLHLGVTSGGTRWLGARTDGTPPVDIGKEFKARGLGWCNAKTEEEWAEWERRYEEEMALKRRVAEWSKGVEPVAPEEGSSVTAVEPPPAKRKQNPPQTTGNALGFSMSKRGAALRANDKPKHIGDVTDLSMPPPSFSESQVITSTQAEKPRQPPATRTAGRARQPPSSPPVRRTYGRASQSPSAPKSPSNLVKSPSVPSFIRPSEPKSPSALRQAASMLPVSPSNAARSRVLVPLNPGRSPRFMSARARGSTSPTASKNNLKRKLPTGSPSQSKDAETYSSFYESVPKRPRLGESQSAKADTNYTSHPDAQNVTQDSLYAPSVPPPTAEPAPYMLAGFQFSTPTKETVSQRRESIAESDSLRLPPKEANLPTLTDLLASSKKTKSPKRRKLRTSLIVDTATPSKTLPGVEPVTPQPITAGVDMNETPTKAPAGDSFGSIPGLTSHRKSPKATEPEPAPIRTKVAGVPLPASSKTNGPELSENPHALNFESPNDAFSVAPGLNLDNAPGIDDGHLEDGDDAAGRHVNSYEGFELNPFAAAGIYEEVDLASPAKSLSSLAGSDSEDTSDEDDEDEVSQNILPTSSLPQSQKEANLVFEGLDPANINFDPQFASTQKEEQEQLKAAVAAPSGTAPIFGISSSNPFLGNLALSQRVSPVRSSQSYGASLSPNKTHSSSQPSAGWGKYNSQFDVKGRVEEVDKLLGRDLDLEFEPATRKERAEDNNMFKGWLKDVPSDEDGED